MIFSPLLLYILLKFIKPKTAFILVTILLIFFPLFYRLITFNPGLNDFEYGITIRNVVLKRLDSIAYGLFAAWIHFYFKSIWDSIKIICLVIGISVMVFILNYESPNSSFYRQVIYFCISPISAMLLLPFAHGIKIGNGKIALAITHISKISYSMYLINMALVAEVIRDNFAPNNELDSIFKYLLFWIVVISGSTILYKYFEKPILHLRDK